MQSRIKNQDRICRQSLYPRDPPKFPGPVPLTPSNMDQYSIRIEKTQIVTTVTSYYDSPISKSDRPRNHGKRLLEGGCGSAELENRLPPPPRNPFI